MAVFKSNLYLGLLVKTSVYKIMTIKLELNKVSLDILNDAAN